MTEGPRDVAAALREQASWCERQGSPFYHFLLLRLAENVESYGICWKMLEPRAADPHRMKLPLRFLAAVHRLVLEGKLPSLARHFPSAGGMGDAAATWPALLAALDQHGPEILARLPETVQTNEVKRSSALLPGFLEVARRTQLPLRLLELGSSAGLNLRWDHYRYEANDSAWGPPDSPMVFRDMFTTDPPQFHVAAASVAERRGCDLKPIDPLSDEGHLTLQSFLWPDQLDRFERLDRAIEVARRVPATVNRADAVTWLAAQLSRPHPGVATVVFHSIVLLYLSPDAQTRVTETLHCAGEQATSEAPLAWLSMEPDGEGQDNVHLTMWPGGTRRAIANAGYHGGAVVLASW